MDDIRREAPQICEQECTKRVKDSVSETRLHKYILMPWDYSGILAL